MGSQINRPTALHQKPIKEEADSASEEADAINP